MIIFYLLNIFFNTIEKHEKRVFDNNTTVIIENQNSSEDNSLKKVEDKDTIRLLDRVY